MEDQIETSGTGCPAVGNGADTAARPLVIGTRGSDLALWQAHAVQDAIAAALPDVATEIRIVKTTGDVNLATPLAKIDDKGLFTGELEAELAEGLVDLCVHSMKDVPTELAPGCRIAACLPRADVRDALVCGPRIADAASLADVPEGSRIGTGSLRRVAQLRARHPHIVPKDIRGNVDTRLAKGHGADYEGAILAVAGLTRLGLADAITCPIEIDEMIPAVGQGAVGVEIRSGDERAEAACAAIDHAVTRACVEAERLVLDELDGSCKVPMGAHARYVQGGGCCDQTLVFDAFVASLDGADMARVHLERAASESTPSELAREALDELLEQGARRIRDQIKADAEKGGQGA